MPATGMLVGGRYRVSGHIGRGSSADVFGARDEILQRAVALKVFRFDGSPGEDRRRVEAEVRLLSSFHHPGLVTVYDAGSLEEPLGADSPYLVMELVNGPTLSQRLDAGPLSVCDTAALAYEVASALDYIHDRGVVHRDIKPANVILGAGVSHGQPFTVKLADFGIALMLDGTRLTMDGFTIGTANYLSPEQALAVEVGPASDIYSLGLVLIQCLTGELAFPGNGVAAAVARLHRPPEIPTEFGAEWAMLLESMTEREPTSRPTAAEVLDHVSRLTDVAALDAVASSGQVRSTVPLAALLAPSTGRSRSSAPSKPLWARTRAAVAAGGAGILVALAAAWIFFAHRSPTPSAPLGTSTAPSGPSGPSAPSASASVQPRRSASSSPSPTARVTPAASSEPVSRSTPPPTSRAATSGPTSKQAPSALPTPKKKPIKNPGPKPKNQS